MSQSEEELRDEYCKAIGMLVVAFNDLEVDLKWQSTFLIPGVELSEDIEEIRIFSRLMMGHLSFSQVLEM